MGFVETVRRRFGGRKRRPITFADISEMPKAALLPPLDRPGVRDDDLTPLQREWRRDGVAILRRFIPDAVMDPYIERRGRLLTEAPEHFRTGWYCNSPYEHIAELRALALYPPLMQTLEALIGEPMMMHLNLTGWVSTERDWHQDDYLNHEFVNGWYCAVWIALDTIDAECGPFEYVPGSHRWPLLRQDKVRGCMSEADANHRHPVSGSLTWPKTSESFVVPAIEAEMAARGAVIRGFTAEKGDVLVWHGRLIHRGSPPRVPNRLRRALITHYSGINHRPDMVTRAQDEHGGWYFQANNPLW